MTHDRIAVKFPILNKSKTSHRNQPVNHPFSKLITLSAQAHFLKPERCHIPQYTNKAYLLKHMHFGRVCRPTPIT